MMRLGTTALHEKSYFACELQSKHRYVWYVKLALQGQNTHAGFVTAWTKEAGMQVSAYQS